MAQYPLPQFIEEEGKITFFLTFRQFFLLVGGGFICFALYYTIPFYLFVAISVVVMIIVVGVAFIKIDDEQITKVIMHFINFYTSDKDYTWGGDSMISPQKEIINNGSLSEKNGPKKTTENNPGLEEYTYSKSNQTTQMKSTQMSQLKSSRKAVEFKGK
ncbi:MAG: hypothetical protein A3D35_01630 [Candidatus Staskawiczbacteria bacterium RIFCSPHIGHO2_02_FULL_34_9]|uniref:PrgI family protein n=1 Tax=Candidatus Staskawiczbacteria bacterium RIFCSPHIGHO2_02_FULL_34_9 TaxID=1802206 RepID=A0A1G2HWV9_9BACT|nr:MAG: hypothetical protein A3D35_01630 [Candidatus Staskawiczbacteria bacterium RIFCSPHIGHO2_02_FULL_34_9]